MFSVKRCLSLVVVCWFAWNAPMAQSYAVQAITFAGVPAFPAAELLTASGLSVGVPPHQAQPAGTPAHKPYSALAPSPCGEASKNRTPALVATAPQSQTPARRNKTQLP
jgi:hypothetical protein